MILFTCPNGHRLHCQSLQPGQWIRCPRCGAITQIPETSTVEPSTIGGLGKLDASSSLLSVHDAVEPDTSETPRAHASPTAESSDAPDGIEAPKKSGGPTDHVEQTWEFYCPKGHLLRGTLADQGRLAQCPECSSRFRVPEFPHPDATAPALPAGTRTPPSGDREAFIRLWEFGHGRPLLCELKRGHVLVVTGYHTDISDDVYGVFSGYFRLTESEGSPTVELLAVPWREISLIRFPMGHPADDET